MKVLVYGAGVIGSLLAVRLPEAGHDDVSFRARGERLTSLRRDGIQLVEEDSTAVRRVPLSVIEHPGDRYDLVVVTVCTHQTPCGFADTRWSRRRRALPPQLGGRPGTAGCSDRPRAGAAGLSFGGTMDGDVIRYRAPNVITRRVPMPIGEPDGRTTPRLEQTVRALRAAGINAKANSQMDAWLKTHAAFEVPLGRAVHAAGGLMPLADDPDGVRAMIRLMRQNLDAIRARPVPRSLVALQVLPERLLVAMLRRFLQSPTAANSGLRSTSPGATAHLERLVEQMRANTEGAIAHGRCTSSTIPLSRGVTLVRRAITTGCADMTWAMHARLSGLVRRRAPYRGVIHRFSSAPHSGVEPSAVFRRGKRRTNRRCCSPTCSWRVMARSQPSEKMHTL